VTAIGEDGLAALAVLFPATAPLDALAGMALTLTPVVASTIASREASSSIP
jgi:hypothetical protein